MKLYCLIGGVLTCMFPIFPISPDSYKHIHLSTFVIQKCWLCMVFFVNYHMSIHVIFLLLTTCQFTLVQSKFEFVLIYLQFEWAWQHPDKSRRLRHLPGKKKKETPFQYRFRIVSEMLRTGPWKRLALTIRYLGDNGYYRIWYLQIWRSNLMTTNVQVQFSNKLIPFFCSC